MRDARKWCSQSYTPECGCANKEQHQRQRCADVLTRATKARERTLDGLLRGLEAETDRLEVPLLARLVLAAENALLADKDRSLLLEGLLSLLSHD